MKYHTAEAFSDLLAREVAWRKKELSTLRLLVDSRSAQGDRQGALMRAGVCLLYAHWEGYVKYTSTAYLDYVASKRLAYGQLTTNLVALRMKGRLSEAADSRSAATLIDVADFFLNGLSEPCTILPSDAVSTKSNLSSKIFRDIVLMLGLDYQPYATKRVALDDVSFQVCIRSG